MATLDYPVRRFRDQCAYGFVRACLPVEFLQMTALVPDSRFGPSPLLVEPDMAELRLLLLDLDAEREGGQHIGELHVHRAQRNVTLTAHFK